MPEDSTRTTLLQQQRNLHRTFELEELPELADGLPPDGLGVLAEEEAAEEGAELGFAEAPEPVGPHAVTRADPRIAQMASDILGLSIMSPRTAQPPKRLRRNRTVT